MNILVHDIIALTFQQGISLHIKDKIYLVDITLQYLYLKLNSLLS